MKDTEFAVTPMASPLESVMLGLEMGLREFMAISRVAEWVRQEFEAHLVLISLPIAPQTITSLLYCVGEKSRSSGLRGPVARGYDLVAH